MHGYPFSTFVEMDPDFANRVDLADQMLPDGAATFAPAGSEQDAMAEFLASEFVSEPFSAAETPPEEDERIQNLTYREDGLDVGVLRPGDLNLDDRLDIADAVSLFQFLFFGSPTRLPCGDGAADNAANVALYDWNGDQTIDLADGTAGLNWLFQGGPAHVLGTECRGLAGCPSACN